MIKKVCLLFKNSKKLNHLIFKNKLLIQSKKFLLMLKLLCKTNKLIKDRKIFKKFLKIIDFLLILNTLLNKCLLKILKRTQILKILVKILNIYVLDNKFNKSIWITKINLFNKIKKKIFRQIIYKLNQKLVKVISINSKIKFRML